MASCFQIQQCSHDSCCNWWRSVFAHLRYSWMEYVCVRQHTYSISIYRHSRNIISHQFCHDLPKKCLTWQDCWRFISFLLRQKKPFKAQVVVNVCVCPCFMSCATTLLTAPDLKGLNLSIHQQRHLPRCSWSHLTSQSLRPTLDEFQPSPSSP
jgi:hypothetical protein